MSVFLHTCKYVLYAVSNLLITNTSTAMHVPRLVLLPHRSSMHLFGYKFATHLHYLEPISWMLQVRCTMCY